MTEKKKWLDKENVNLMVAVCAVLISAASFYATYVQSLAAETQVKAETWPYIQISSGNYDLDKERKRVYVEVDNVGVGPARLVSFQLFYENEIVPNISELVAKCCLDPGEVTRDENGNRKREYGTIITSSPSPGIVPAGDLKTAFSFVVTDENEAFWEKLNKARFKLTAKACYCSLLDECFETEFYGEPVPVKTCRAQPGLDFSG